jgi:hypothetical protein
MIATTLVNVKTANAYARRVGEVISVRSGLAQMKTFGRESQLALVMVPATAALASASVMVNGLEMRARKITTAGKAAAAGVNAAWASVGATTAFTGMDASRAFVSWTKTVMCAAVTANVAVMGASVRVFGEGQTAT